MRWVLVCMGVVLVLAVAPAGATEHTEPTTTTTEAPTTTTEAPTTTTEAPTTTTVEVVGYVGDRASTIGLLSIVGLVSGMGVAWSLLRTLHTKGH